MVTSHFTSHPIPLLYPDFDAHFLVFDVVVVIKTALCEDRSTEYGGSLHCRWWNFDRFWDLRIQTMAGRAISNDEGSSILFYFLHFISYRFTTFIDICDFG